MINFLTLTYLFENDNKKFYLFTNSSVQLFNNEVKYKIKNV